MIVLIDNYDSFTANLYQQAAKFDPDIHIIRNDAKTAAEIEAMHPDHILLSPGPGRPEEAGILIELIEKLSSKIPILGVCLGHQAIAQAFGGKVGYAKSLMHGKSSICTKTAGSVLFDDLPGQFPVARYHSLSVEEASLPDCLLVTARSDDGEIMALRHARYPVFGVQFHPESILTPDGDEMMRAFLSIQPFHSSSNSNHPDRLQTQTGKELIHD